MPLKSCVRLHGISPEILVAYIEAQPIFKKYDYPCIMTSCKDGKHSNTSLHYVGDAIDLRSKHIPAMSTKRLIIKEMIEALGDEFDIMLEDIGEPREHIHIEFQPKGVPNG